MFIRSLRLGIAIASVVGIIGFSPSPRAQASNAAISQGLISPFRPSHTIALDTTEGGPAIYTLDQIAGPGDLVLSGASPSAWVQAAIPIEWKLTGATLHLTVSHSPVLRQDSSLTLIVNGNPVSSLLLTTENIGPVVWDVTVPPAMLVNTDTLSIQFAGYLRVSDDVCADIQNEANWARVASGSTFEYTFDRQPFTPELSTFPYPFIRTRSLEPDAAVMVLPSSATGAEQIPALYLSSAMGAQATSRGISLYALLPEELTDANKTDYDLILVGRADRQALIQELAAQWPIQVSATGAFVDKAGQALPPDTGVIMMIASPWNPTRGILAVTGATDDAVKNAALALRQPQFANLARGDFALITAPPAASAAGDVNWSSATLHTLGYTNQSVAGLGKNTLRYSLNMPTSLVPESLKVNVLFSHSPFVSTDRSYLVLYINGVPQAGLTLSAENESQAVWQVTVPGTDLVPGRNKMELLFDLHLADYEACDEQYLDRAWAFVYASTSVQAKFTSVSPVADLGNFPVPFDAGTLFVFPSQPTANERAGAFRLLTELGVQLGGRAQGIDLITADAVTDAALKGRHAILFGQAGSSNWMVQALQAAPIQFNGAARSLNSAAVNLSVADGESVGLIQELPSPWDNNRTVMIITGTDDQGIGWASNLLVDAELRQKLRGDVAMVNARGFLTAFDSRSPAQVAEEAATVAAAVSGPTINVVQIALIAAAGLIAIGLIVILVRRRLGQ